MSKVRELGLAVMLLGVVVVFLLCNALALIANLLEVGYRSGAKLTNHPQHFFGTEIHPLTQTNNLLVTVNRWPGNSQQPFLIFLFIIFSFFSLSTFFIIICLPSFYAHNILPPAR